MEKVKEAAPKGPPPAAAANAYTKIDLTEKALTEQHLSKFAKEDLISLIVSNKTKLVEKQQQKLRE